MCLYLGHVELTQGTLLLSKMEEYRGNTQRTARTQCVIKYKWVDPYVSSTRAKQKEKTTQMGGGHAVRYQ